MRLLYLCALGLLFLLPAAAAAQEIHGRILVANGAGRTPAAGASVTVRCGGRSASTSTDSNGLYSLRTPGGGECSLQVQHVGKPSTRIKLHVPARGASANLELQAHAAGWILRRKG